MMRPLRELAIVVATIALAACSGDDNTMTGPAGPTHSRPTLDLDDPAVASPLVSLGVWTSCALRAEGTVACWSEEDLGAIAPPPGPFTHLAVKNSTACAVAATGGVQCWGQNAWLQASPPAPPAGLTFVRVAMSATSGCGILSDGTLSCWGNPLNGVRNAPSGTFTQVSIGSDHACAVRTDGTLACWGNDPLGLNAGVPAAPAGTQFVQVALGVMHDCALFSNGTIQCWGDNSSGQRDVPALAAGVTYTQVSVSDNWTKDASQGANTCALRSDGTAVCWGANGSDQNNVPALPAGLTYTNIDAGTRHVCAARSDGEVACWGRNLYGESTPPPALNLLKFTQPIAFTPPVPAEATPGSTFTLVPNAGSGEPLVLVAATPATCAVEGTTLSFLSSGVCTFTADRAGNEHYEPAPQLVVNINLGRRPQVITFAPALPAESIVGTTLTLGATDGGSGNPREFTVETPETCSLTGTTLSLTAIGHCTVAADQAGNDGYDAGHTSATIAVRWAFGGFVGLAAAPSLNRPNAGSSVAVTFSLGGNQGLAIVAAGSPTIAEYGCGGAVPVAGAGTPVRSPGNSTPLVYNASTGLYTYTWKTEKSWSKRCYQLSVRLADGSVHTALFQLR